MVIAAFTFASFLASIFGAFHFTSNAIPIIPFSVKAKTAGIPIIPFAPKKSGIPIIPF